MPEIARDPRAVEAIVAAVPGCGGCGQVGNGKCVNCEVSQVYRLLTLMGNGESDVVRTAVSRLTDGKTDVDVEQITVHELDDEQGELMVAFAGEKGPVFAARMSGGGVCVVTRIEGLSVGMYEIRRYQPRSNNGVIRGMGDVDWRYVVAELVTDVARGVSADEVVVSTDPRVLWTRDLWVKKSL